VRCGAAGVQADHREPAGGWSEWRAGLLGDPRCNLGAISAGRWRLVQVDVRLLLCVHVVAEGEQVGAVDKRDDALGVGLGHREEVPALVGEGSGPRGGVSSALFSSGGAARFRIVATRAPTLLVRLSITRCGYACEAVPRRLREGLGRLGEGLGEGSEGGEGWGGGGGGGGGGAGGGEERERRERERRRRREGGERREGEGTSDMFVAPSMSWRMVTLARPK